MKITCPYSSQLPKRNKLDQDTQAPVSGYQVNQGQGTDKRKWTGQSDLTRPQPGPVHASELRGQKSAEHGSCLGHGHCLFVTIGDLGGLGLLDCATSSAQTGSRQLLQHQESCQRQDNKQHCGRSSWTPRCSSVHDGVRSCNWHLCKHKVTARCPTATTGKLESAGLTRRNGLLRTQCCNLTTFKPAHPDPTFQLLPFCQLDPSFPAPVLYSTV